MKRLKQILRGTNKLRTGGLLAGLALALAMTAAPADAFNDDVSAVQYISCDDLSNHVYDEPAINDEASDTGAVNGVEPPATTESTTEPAGDQEPDVKLIGRSKNGNNGHGNNEDGVDSSNPSQGIGGPNGAVDQSCDGTGACIDDESGGSTTTTTTGTTETTTTTTSNGNSGNSNGKQK